MTDHNLDPVMDQTWLKPVFIGQFGDGHFVSEVRSNNLGFLIRREVTTIRANGTYLRVGNSNSSGKKFQFRVMQNSAAAATANDTRRNYCCIKIVKANHGGIPVTLNRDCRQVEEYGHHFKQAV